MDIDLKTFMFLCGGYVFQEVKSSTEDTYRLMLRRVKVVTHQDGSKELKFID